MHFSFSPERYSESMKYRADIKHDALLIEETYTKNKNQGLFDLAHRLTTGKESEMKLMTFDFSYSSGIQYLMSTRNVRNEMIRVLQTENTPQAKEIINELNKEIVSERKDDIKFYNGLDDESKKRVGRQEDLRENYKSLLDKYPSEREKEPSRVPIQIDLDNSVEELSPFVEEQTISRNLDKSRK